MKRFATIMKKTGLYLLRICGVILILQGLAIVFRFTVDVIWIGEGLQKIAFGCLIWWSPVKRWYKKGKAFQ